MDAATSNPWWRRLLGPRPAGRVRGSPPSGNGASSFHLRWEFSGDAVGASVVLEVLEPPTVDRLYFWALQADFADDRGRPRGGAHLGLQWHPRHPGSTAVNWGGYGAAGGELEGTASGLASATGNVNTRDYPWTPTERYHLEIERVGVAGAEVTAWRGSVTDQAGRRTVVRDLLTYGESIVGVVMWSVVFARCEHPSVAVRWSDPRVQRPDGSMVQPSALTLNYQSHADGGCANTVSVWDGGGVVQRTNTERINPQGTQLPVPS